MIKLKVTGYVVFDDEYEFQDAVKSWDREMRILLHDYDAYLDLADAQVHAVGAKVMLRDPTGEIEDEGPAEIVAYQGNDFYTVEVLEENRTDEDDIDGLREVEANQIFPIEGGRI